MKNRFSMSITALALAFLYLPIIILIISSFNESRFGGGFGNFSLKWYSQLFQERAIWKALSNSLIIAISATAASTILGTLAALALFRFQTSRLQKAHIALIYTPLVIPDILMGISLLLFFMLLNISLGLFTIFIAHTTFCLSYVTMVVLSRLQNLDFSVVEAAQDLGANWWIVLKRVLIPILMPGIGASALLAFTMSLDDFIITFFVSGPGSTTLPIYVYSMIKFGSPPLINALSALLLVVTFAIVWVSQRLTKEN
ncbi:MAG: spermidine/putrescine transport system permease protein potC [Chlamydiales bacterium]|jgi:spermidine/putrescine transport system permease protein|nr:spermidine/putrescine transport system permease protein potC [Chlamydiales bacterium]